MHGIGINFVPVLHAIFGNFIKKNGSLETETIGKLELASRDYTEN